MQILLPAAALHITVGHDNLHLMMDRRLLVRVSFYWTLVLLQVDKPWSPPRRPLCNPDRFYWGFTLHSVFVAGPTLNFDTCSFFFKLPYSNRDSFDENLDIFFMQTFLLASIVNTSAERLRQLGVGNICQIKTGNYSNYEMNFFTCIHIMAIRCGPR